jgi:hypothetical protein
VKAQELAEQLSMKRADFENQGFNFCIARGYDGMRHKTTGIVAKFSWSGIATLAYVYEFEARGGMDMANADHESTAFNVCMNRGYDGYDHIPEAPLAYWSWHGMMQCARLHKWRSWEMYLMHKHDNKVPTTKFIPAPDDESGLKLRKIKDKKNERERARKMRKIAAAVAAQQQ